MYHLRALNGKRRIEPCTPESHTYRIVQDCKATLTLAIHQSVNISIATLDPVIKISIIVKS